ncbi:MAG: NADH-quinone oxidoreductase subunit NuoH [Fidelibacterota bacterium]
MNMWTDIIIILIKIALVLGGILFTVAYLGLAERRISAFIQDRRGPNRVGPFGMFQPIADGLKFFLKEDIIPLEANRWMFLLAPAIIMIPALLTFAVIPFGSPLTVFGRTIKLQIADVNIGILYIFALTSLSVYGIVLGGWGSNSKYPLVGGLRCSAQMISYELALGLSVIGVLMWAQSLRLPDIVNSQLQMWNVIRQPVGFIIFICAAFAETNRLPFDLAEAEQELVGGYHTEYSSMKFAMFYMAEYANIITSSALAVTLFFGGWDVPILDESSLGIWGVLISVLSFAIKTGIFLFIFIWVRWTLPRFRYDQLMKLGWKILLPLALLNILVTGFIISFF